MITVTISAPDVIGKQVQFTIRKGRAPKRAVSCLTPDGLPQAC